jgi:hypothetical protein
MTTAPERFAEEPCEPLTWHTRSQIQSTRSSILATALTSSDASKLRNGLQLSNDPTVGSWGHEHYIVSDYVFLMNHLSAVHDLQLEFGRIV